MSRYMTPEEIHQAVDKCAKEIGEALTKEGITYVQHMATETRDVCLQEDGIEVPLYTGRQELTLRLVVCGDKEISGRDDRWPEHAKMEKIVGESESLGTFLHWLQTEKKILLEEYDMDDQPYTINSLLAEYFDIDVGKIAKEKAEMYLELQEEAHPRYHT